MIAVASTAPLFLRTLLSRRRVYRRCFWVPLILGLLLAPLVGWTVRLAEAVCRPTSLDVVVSVAMLGWPVVLGEVAYRACRTA